MIKKTIITSSILLSFFLSQSALANCKSELDAANKAQDERNRACHEVSKPLSEKKKSDASSADCKSKDNAYKAAKKRLQNCTNK